MAISKRTSLLIAILVFVALATTSVLTYRGAMPPVKEAATDTPAKSPQPTVEPTEAYAGQIIAVGDSFHIKVPDGWRASVSSQSSFIAVQFARPGQLESLVYAKGSSPAVDYNGIPAWDGLTEHFYVRAITAPSQAFNPAAHAEVTSQPFTFADGTAGTKYLVTKHATEAKKWGGLLKDSEWYGRVFAYKQGNLTVEAHLAFYPSTKIDQQFFEQVAGSITK